MLIRRSLQIQKAKILLDCPEPARQQQGRKELEELLGRQPPISEPKALEALNSVARARKDRDPRVETIWERAVTIRPHDERLYISWFHTKFNERKWKQAQKVGSSLHHGCNVGWTHLFCH
jgi:hypothetical protein